MKSNLDALYRLVARENFCVAALLTAFALPANGGATIGATYSGSFSGGSSPSAQTVQDWISFRNNLAPLAYDTVTISGTSDTTGRTLTDARRSNAASARALMWAMSAAGCAPSGSVRRTPASRRSSSSRSSVNVRGAGAAAAAGERR